MQRNYPTAKLLLLAAAAAVATATTGAAAADAIVEPIDLADNTPAGAWLADLRRILGLDVESAATLSILNPNHAVVNSLAINTSAGYLYASQAIDRDDLCHNDGRDSTARLACCRADSGNDAPCEVQLQLSYSNSAGRRRIAAVRVRLADVNDNAPTFRRASTTLRVPEGPLSSVGPPVSIPGAGGVFQASDPDQGANGAILYRLLPADESSASGEVQSGVSTMLPFRLDQSDRNRLVLLVTGDLDREKQAAYRMRLLAIDGGRPALTGTLSVTVELLDVNDESPVFEQSEYSVRLREDATIGSVLVKVRATDRDAGPNGEVHYSLSSATGPLSILGSADGEGVVTLRSQLDAETQPRIEVYIVAQDRGYPPKSAEAKLTVSVEDVNDEKPRIEIVYLNPDSTAPSGSRGLLTENAHSEEVAKAEVTDPDTGSGGRVNCEADNEGFVLTPLHLSDLSVSSAATAGSAASGGASIAVARREFLVRSRAPFDREESNGLLQFNIVCTDEGRPVRLTGSAAVRLRLLDVNDNAPTFSRPAGYEFQLPENEPAMPGGRYRLGAVTAVDRDEGANARVVYAIDQDPSGAFQIDSATGELFAVQPLDREKLVSGTQRAQLHLRVSAADSNPNHRRAIADVRVSVLDRNDCPPRFVNEHRKSGGIGGPGVDYEFSVEESSGGGVVGGASFVVVGTVRAEDEDEPGPIEYAMQTSGLDPETAASFRVDRHSGQVRAIRPLDRETRAVYVFPVTARDAPRPGSGDPRLTGTATVTVHVLDVNDCAPEFVSPAAPGESISVADNARAGYSVATVKARDPDLDDNGRVTYAILPAADGSSSGAGGTNLFNLDPTNGLVFVARSLTPRDVRPEPYELIVEAADSGKPSPLRTRTKLRVFVVSSDASGGNSGGKSLAEAAGERRGGKTGSGDSLAQQRTRTTIVLGLIVFFFLLLIVVTFAVLILLRPCRSRPGGRGSSGGGGFHHGSRQEPAGEAASDIVGDLGGVRHFKTVRGYLVAGGGSGKSGDPTTLMRGSIDASSPPELYNLLTTGRQPVGGNSDQVDSTPMAVVRSLPAAHLSDYQSLRPGPGQGTGMRRKKQPQQQQQQHPLDEQAPVYYQAGSPVGAFNTIRGFERANSAGIRTAAISAATQQQQQPQTGAAAGAAGSAKSQPVTPMDKRKFSAFNPYADASFV